MQLRRPGLSLVQSLHHGAATGTIRCSTALCSNVDVRLHAFANVCRHRGYIVASGSECRKTLQCPYHGWTYNLDGSLRRAPRSEGEPAFDKSALGLRPLAVETCAGAIFVNPDRDA